MPVDCPSVSVSFHEAGALAARRLIEQGCTSVAIVGTNSNRLSGFVQAAGEASLTARVFQVAQSAELLSWIRQSAGPVGVFAVTDLLALKLIAQLAAAGIKVPDDVRVIGHDDRDFGLHLDPALTTIHQHYREAGREGLHTLIRQIYGEAVSSRVLSPTLVVRESA
jgi:DNA-binding LacI/PurR family transcriptional regulator